MGSVISLEATESLTTSPMNISVILVPSKRCAPLVSKVRALVDSILRERSASLKQNEGELPRLPNRQKMES